MSWWLEAEEEAEESKECRRCFNFVTRRSIFQAERSRSDAGFVAGRRRSLPLRFTDKLVGEALIEAIELCEALGK